MVRIYLTGRVTIEGERVIEEAGLPGLQGRLALAVLALTPNPIPRADLAEVMWSGEPPTGWEKGMAPILSKLRRAFADAGGDGGAIASSAGSVELRRETPIWVDLTAATRSLDAAEGALRAGRPREGWVGAAIASAVFRRPFLPGADGVWVNEQRRAHHASFVRCYEVLADIWTALDDPVQASNAARGLVSADPLRETGYVKLMRAHAAEGNRAAALRVYAEAREVLVSQLGVEPSSHLQRVYEDLL